MNRLLRTVLIIHPFVHYALFSLKLQISRILVLTGMIAVLIIYLYSLIQKKEKIPIPWIWAYILVQSMFLGLPNYCIHISIFFLLYTTIAQMKIDWEYVLKPLGYVCIAMSLLSILQKFGIRQFTYSSSVSPGLLGNSTDSAMYIVAISPFLFLHRKSWILFIIPIVAVYMLNSASAVLGMLTVLFVYLFLKRRYLISLIFVILGSIGTGLWFDKIVKMFNPQAKFTIWSRAMTDWKDFAWFGSGLGNFAGRYKIGIVTYNMQNHYLYILYTLGMVGLFLLLWWLIPILKNQRKTLPYVSVISVLVMATCSIPLRVYPIVMLTAINLGILTKKEIP